MQPADSIPLLPLAWTVLRQLLALALLAIAAAGAGHLFTGRLATASRREALAVATAAGLGVLGSALFILGVVGGLRRWVVLALLAAAVAAGVRALAAIRRARGGDSDEGDGGADPAPRFRPAPRTAALALTLAVLPTFFWSLFPPTGFDATTYHLPYVRAFVAAQRLVVVPDVIFPIFPQLGEALFTAMLLATGADVTTHVVQLLALVVVALLLDAAGRRFFSPAAGLWAAALWLAHPLAHYQAASAYVDLLLALFCLLAVHAWEAWREGRGAKDGLGAGDGRAGRGWLVLSGAAGGFAAAVKYLGLLWLGVLGLVTLAWAPRRRRLAAAAVVGLAALAVAGPWYARIHHHTGNPVHPLLDSLFAEEGEASELDAIVGIAGDGSASSTNGAAGLLAAVGRALARPAELGRFAWRASFDRRWFSRQSALAPWTFLLVPLAAAFCLRDRRLLRWLLLVAVYALLWTTHDPRYQLPSMALLALAGGGALHHLGRRFPGLGERMTRPAAAWALAAALALPGPAYAVYKVARHGPLPVTPQARQAHLDRELAGHAGVRRLNELHGSDYTVFTLDGPYLTYFARGRLLGHALGPDRAGRVVPLLGDPAALYRELRAMDVDHLLVVHRHRFLPLRRDAAFDRFFRRLSGDGRYDLFALRPAAAATPAAGPGG